MTTASWGQLWDQADSIAFHTQKGIEFLERYGAFLKERAAVEEDYATKLRALVKKYSSRKKDEVENQFSYARTFVGVLNEVGDIAGQHEVLGETYKQELLKDIASTSRELKDQRKVHLHEASRLQQTLEYTIGLMNKAQKEYSKTFKEAEAAQLKYLKAEGNMDLSRAELEKTRNNSIFKSQQSEDAKNSYALQQQKVNELQSAHYSSLLPDVLEKLRTMDETRVRHIQRVMERCVEVEQNSLPLVQRCLEEMKTQAKKIDPIGDSQLVVDRYKTGYAPPQDYVFEDFGSPLAAAQAEATGEPQPQLVNGNAELNRPQKHRGSNRTLNRSQSNRGGRIGKMLFGSHKSLEYQEDYSDLPPSQRCQKLNKKIQQLETQINTRMQARDGIIKMQNVYKENPKLGDLSQVETQLAQYNAELDDLNMELNKFRNYLSEASSQLNVPITAVGTPSPRRERTPPSSNRSSNSLPMGAKPPQRSSMSEESISSEGSSAMGNAGAAVTSTPINGQPRSPSHNSTHLQTASSNYHGSSVSPESGIGESSQMLSYADSEPYDQTTIDGELYIEPDAVLGTCTAIYTFEGGSDGTLAIRDGDEMLLMERDDGDGWTRVRKMHTHEEGFVPTSYLNCKWYPSC